MNKPYSENDGAFRQRKWRGSMTPGKREEYLAERKKRFAEHGIFKQRELRAKNPGQATAYGIAAYHRRPEHYKAVQKKYREQMKTETFAVYGGVCQCCGEDEMEFLTIDHIVPTKNGHRLRSGSALYQELRNQGYPSGYQVLCFNCNCAKRTNPVCPHKAHFLKLVTAPRNL